MKKLLGILVALATLGLATPAFACGVAGCDCTGTSKQASCDGKKTEDSNVAGKNCGQTGDKTADNDDSAAKATAEAKLTIDGMSCGGCANHLTSTLEDVDGVVEADVSFDDGEATVKYDDEQVDTDALVDAVENTHDGKFSAELVSQSSVTS